MKVLLQTRGLAKSYAGPVLSGVDFDLRAGEVHALVGENGAGKSTLCNIIAGLRQADAGEMTLDGEAYHPPTKKDAERQGVRIVLQELSLINTLTVAENLFLDGLPNRWGWINGRALADAARAALDKVSLTELDPATPVSGLGIGQKQLVEIAAGLSRECRVLILDEPTAALTATDARRLFAQVEKLRAAGVGIVFISHHLDEVQEIADRVSVLRNGKLVAVKERGAYTVDEIISLMVGRDLAATADHTSTASERVVLRVEGLRAPPAVRDVSFEVRAGEILGFAGLMGSGRTETMRAIFGADTRTGGKVFLDGREVDIRQPSDAVKLGIGFLTEDRKAQGLLLPKPLRMNITLARLRDEIGARAGWIDSAKETGVAETWIERLRVRASSSEQNAVDLSGGNQQKVVLARWLYRDCAVLICDEPTRGIDVGARQEIYRLLRELADAGKALVVVSSDLHELLTVSDRIAVLSAGKLAATFSRGDWTEDRIMAAAFSEFTQANVPAASPA